MDEQLEARLREAGEDLRASHDDALIADVIGVVEETEGEAASETAEILRLMTEAE